MNEAVAPDWKHNPVFRPAFEAGVREQRRRHPLSLMDIAKPMQKDRNQALVGSMLDEWLEELIQAMTNILTVRPKRPRSTWIRSFPR